MQANYARHSLYNPSGAVQAMLPLELLHGSTSLDWPAVIVRHYAFNAFEGTITIPGGPDHSVILELT